MKKKILSAVTAISIIATSAMPISFASAESGNALVLGDVIATGDSSYAALASDVLGKNLVSETNSDYTTEDILNLVETDKVKAEISNANIIFISAGSNDILKPALEVFDTDKYSTLDEATESVDATSTEVKELYSELQTKKLEVAINLGDICTAINEINPNAKIVISNIYNPLSLSSENSSTKLSLVSSQLESEIVSFINGEISDIDNVIVSDIYTIFKDNADFYTGIEALDVSPSEAGQLAIAAKTLSSLETNEGSSEKMTSVYDSMSVETKKAFCKDHTDEFKAVYNYLNFEFGDINSDGNIDSSDAVEVLVHYANLIVGKTSTIDMNAADLNFDNTVDSGDAVNMLIYYANSIVGNSVDIITFINSK